MRSRLTSNRFVGRVGELGELLFAAREAISGRPTLVLLGGDSGVGKTRLVAELERGLSAEPDSPVVLRGEGVEQSDAELPYAPLLGVLRPLVRERHPALDTLTAGTRSELATLLPGLDAPPVDGGPRERDERFDGPGQLRLFEAILALLAAVAESSPLVLVIEDVHWADRSTRAFVSFLVRSLRAERIMLLLTYRTDELHRRHPLRPLLTDLERLDRTRRVELEPFDRDELSEALADILGAPPDEPLLARVFARSEGNPLYTEELLAAGLDGRGAAPRSLSDAFLQRIERLSAPAQRTARAVAVGRALDEPALAVLTGQDRDELETGLREAISEQILVADDDGADFCFRHALLREALYEDLLPGERGELHVALAHHLESGTGEPNSHEQLKRWSRIAFHYTAAGDQPAALRSSIAAGMLARQAQAFGEAADMFTHALELWPRVGDAERIAGIDHVELLHRAGFALSMISERNRADAVLRGALDELDPGADPARFAHVLIAWARVLWTLNCGDEAVREGERALAMIEHDDPFCDRVEIRSWLARMATLRGKYRQAHVDAEAALTDALAVGDRAAEIDLLNTLGMVKVHLGDVDGGLDSMHRSIALASERDDWDQRVTAHHNLADILGRLGRPREALATAQEALAILPSGHRKGFEWLILTVSECAFAVGDWALARGSLEIAAERLTGTLSIFQGRCEAALALGTGDEARAREVLDSIAGEVAESTEPQWIGPIGSLTADLHMRSGELELAQRDVEDAIGRLEVCTDDASAISGICRTGLRVEAERAQRARDLGDTAMRRDATARARLHVSRIEAAEQDGGPVQAAAVVEARAEMGRVRGRPSASAWARAAAAWQALELPYPAAIARWREAEAHVAVGDRDAAGVAAATAVTGARTLGSLWLERETRGLAERARLSLDGAGDGGAAPEPGPRAAAPAEDPFGLTARERQVLALLAQGATNRQIGAQLYMAEKTASVHVSRILAKLDVQGRTEAAAVAHRLHLV